MAPNLRSRSAKVNYNVADTFSGVLGPNEPGNRSQNSDDEFQPTSSTKKGKRKLSGNQHLTQGSPAKASRRNTGDRSAPRNRARNATATKNATPQPNTGDDVAMDDAPTVEPATHSDDASHPSHGSPATETSSDVPMPDASSAERATKSGTVGRPSIPKNTCRNESRMPVVPKYVNAPPAIAPDTATKIRSRFANVLPSSRKYANKDARLAATKDVMEARKQSNGIQASSQTVSKSQPEYKDKLDSKKPPLSNIEEIFNDLVKNAFKYGFRDAIETLREVCPTIKIATMCSGTESPLLAVTETERGRFNTKYRY